ncbi:3-beta-hydroxysteroid-Delta(8),Delta(7)-isomerase-like [Babylonia areolata]|uniref:3-beta-hydroxysteroid-Delta(8), Delta(7)-isomerase-like n=1 Tax=Babylonia areolata TaxID=304850 RepID=UPI003FCFE895
MVEKVNHPYYPRSLKLPHFKANDKDITELLSVFFSIVGIFIVVTWLVTGRAARKPLSLTRRLVVCWFVACGFIHTVLEGYFGYFHATLAGQMDFLAQLWKEYGKGDSRYISSDTFTVCMERITAIIDGPLAFLSAWAFLANSKHRYVLQLLLSLCQLYGDSLYFLTAIFEGFIHGEYLHPLYFWFYFVFLNSLWIIIPLLLIIDSYRHLSRCQAVFDSNASGKNKKLH